MTLVGYATRAVGADIGYYLNDPGGLIDEPANDFLFDESEALEVTRLCFRVERVSDDGLVADAALRVYEGDTPLVEIECNTCKMAVEADSGP